MDFALAVGLFVFGAVCGGLIVAAWNSDSPDFEPTEHGPFSR